MPRQRDGRVFTLAEEAQARGAVFVVENPPQAKLPRATQGFTEKRCAPRKTRPAWVDPGLRGGR